MSFAENAANRIVQSFQHAFLTGSRVYGYPGDESDWDVCTSCDNGGVVSAIHTEFPLDHTDESTYNGGTKYIFTDGSILNIIPLHHMDLIYWALATVQMKSLKTGGLCGVSLKDRTTRHCMFELMRTTYKLAYPLVEYQEGINMLQVIKGVQKC